MKVLITGPESSGTSVIARIFVQSGADVIHRSATWDRKHPNLREASQECDAVIIVFRDPYATMQSQAWTKRAYEKLQEGYESIFNALNHYSKPRFVVTYEHLVINPRSINPVLLALGLKPQLVTEIIRNENDKYYQEFATNRAVAS